MKKSKKIKAGKIIGATLGTAFIITSAIAKTLKGKSQYLDEQEQQNPMEGRQVVFVEDEKDPENADGARGHLVSIGESKNYLGFYEKYIKRAIDIALSFGGMVILSPALLGVSIAIKIDDPGPILFTQKRVGLNKRFFKLHKFRSMKMSTPHNVPTHMLDNPEQYITKVGAFLRKTSLDELPQIWDIFIGNMSIIGPRPALWNQDKLVALRDQYGANDVMPGLTGWAQINGRDELELETKAARDGEYVKNKSFLFDCRCFLETIKKVFNNEGVVEGGTGEMRKATGRNYTSNKTPEELIGNIGFGGPVTINTDCEKRVLVTGERSYIGESFKVYASEHYPSLKIDSIDMIDGSWRDKSFSKYDAVYHVAGLAHADFGSVDESTKEKYYAINTDLAVEVCEKAKKDGVSTFIFMSSMIVYGDSAPYGKRKIVDENTVPAPENFYGDSKLQADVAVRELADDKFKVIVLRPPMIYGKGSKGNYPILAKFAKKLPVFPKVDNQRSMLYIENLCEFLCQIMLIEKIEKNAIVLIPQNKEWTNTSDMVKNIADVSNNNIKLMEIMKPAVLVGGKIPGEIGGLVNKAFGNSAYSHGMSDYGFNYNVVDLNASIERTEKIQNA